MLDPPPDVRPADCAKMPTEDALVSWTSPELVTCTWLPKPAVPPFAPSATRPAVMPALPPPPPTDWPMMPCVPTPLAVSAPELMMVIAPASPP